MGTPRASRHDSLKAPPWLYLSSSFSQNMPSLIWRSVASFLWGRPISLALRPRRWGARITAPVTPVQCSGSRAASFSARSGLSPLPKIDSTKSRLDTHDPGTKKRTSEVLSGVKPWTSGQARGRRRSVAMISVGFSWLAVYGRVARSEGGLSAMASMRLKVTFGTSFLSSEAGRPPSTMWNTPLVVRLSDLGLCTTPWETR
mmetsp:Transcript_130380/g.194041  ORF Transcript_130380/g.194041 Transcript_130380/m.194041 type:complete len:201 (+) Transcript_130380:2866-3468(+)